VAEMLIVLQREFVERVRTKSFILSTVLAPLFLVGMFAVPILLEVSSTGGETTLVIVDEAPTGIGESVEARLRREPRSEREERFLVDRVRQPLATVQDSLRTLVLSETIDGYLHLPPGTVVENVVQYRGRSVTNMDRNEQIGDAVSAAVQENRMDEAGLDAGEVARLLQPVRVAAARITSAGDEGQSAASGMIFAMVVGMFLYFLILLYGTQVMQSVQEEKTNRIAEVLVSSIRAKHLMLGKVLGVGLVALLQVSIWIVAGVILFSQRARLASAPDLPAPPSAFSLGVGPWEGVALGMFALLGFFQYASLFAAAGAAAESAEDAQRFFFPIFLPLIVPIFLQVQILAEPRGRLATALGWLPLTSPMVTPMRMGAGGIPTVEIVGSLLMLVAGVWLIGILAGKIYRVGILSAGKRPSMRELGRWLRTA
jgi:ABC-2 type transport system permease protein